MSKAENTKRILLLKAKQLFWTRGYSNVPLRDISKDAGVDVALISRYFGSKRGLFEASLEDIPALDISALKNTDDLISAVVEMFSTTPRGGPVPSPTAAILLNASDPEVGELVRFHYTRKWQDPLNQIIGNRAQAAMFSAAMLGMSVAEKALHLPGIAPADSDAYKEQLRKLLKGALTNC
ncbi:MAG: TetR family transcriptional regulator [Dinoroseobacter sp.]|nr:TetR family transcriptional regulator [Dinoroseobacter sp.]